MLAEPNLTPEAQRAMRAVLQKVATGPEYSKDLSYEEAYEAMRLILNNEADPVQAGVFLIALRMKRETMDENKGVLQAIIDATPRAVAEVDVLVDVADPYDGYTRGLPASPLLAPVLAALNIPAVSHGLLAVGPKYGITHRMVLDAAGVNVDMTPQQAAEAIADPGKGWAYVDQRYGSPALYDLVNLRTRIVKRPCLTTVEVLVGPVRAKGRTHLLTGYVHKPYPPIYTDLARFSGFDAAMIVRGVEGGIIPSLQQEAKVFYYEGDGDMQEWTISPKACGIDQSTRAVPLPDHIPKAKVKKDDLATDFDSEAAAGLAAEKGLAALQGEAGPSYDSLVYAGAICLVRLGRAADLGDGAGQVRNVLDSGAAYERLKALGR